MRAKEPKIVVKLNLVSEVLAEVLLQIEAVILPAHNLYLLKDHLVVLAEVEVFLYLLKDHLVVLAEVEYVIDFLLLLARDLDLDRRHLKLQLLQIY